MSRYVFGPIASRRLGASLGVDLVKAKTCSLDCIYCEAGATTVHTLDRTEAVPVDAVIAELRTVLGGNPPKIDFVTFSGAGEPTLNSRIGDVIRFLKAEFPQYPVCLLTNGCGLFDPALRRELAGLDVAVPSLDASNEAEFQTINRPAAGLTFAMLADGLRAFSRESTAKIWLELFVVPGVNDSDASIARFADIIRSLRVDKIQLNTLDRPGVLDWVRPAPPETLAKFAAALSPIAPVETAARRDPEKETGAELVRTEMVCRILEITAKRDATAEDLAREVEAELPVVEANLARLTAAGMLRLIRRPDGVFYRRRV